MAMAAAAARRVSLALTRPTPSSPLAPVRGVLTRDLMKVEPSTQSKRFCATSPPPPPPPPPPSVSEKIDEVLKLLRSGGYEVEMNAMHQRIGRLEAKVYYGGILFGVFAGATMGFPLLGRDLLNSFEDIQEDQKGTEKLFNDMDERLKVVEGAVCGHKTEELDITTPSTDAEGSAPRKSWVVRLLAYLKGF